MGGGNGYGGGGGQMTRHLFKAFKPRASSKIKRNTLGYQAINEWNTLSNSVVSSENINQLKTRLEPFWETKEFKYDPSRFHDN